MSQSYSLETRKILEDFLQTLERQDNIDQNLLMKLRQLVATGTLGHEKAVAAALQSLMEQDNERS